MKEQSDLVISQFLLFTTINLGARKYMFLNSLSMHVSSLFFPICILVVVVWRDTEEGTLEEKILRALQPLDKI